MTREEAEAMTYQDYVKEDERDSGWDREFESWEDDSFDVEQEPEEDE